MSYTRNIEWGNYMKKQYTQPELGVKHYAQFENVFTACSKTGEGAVNPFTNKPCERDNDPDTSGRDRAAYNTINGSC